MPARALLVMALLLAGDARAQFATVPLPGSPVAASTNSGGGPNLVLDDGTPELAVGLQTNGEFLWFNQFGPPDIEFPLQITEIEVYFASGGGVAVGDTFDVYVYYSTEPSPSLGATFLGSLTDQPVAVVDTFDVRVLPAPLLVSAPADILIAVVNRGMVGPNVSPASIDLTTYRDSSWIGIYETSPPDPPTIPAPTMGRIGDAGLFGNWLIRGTYVTVPLGGDPRVSREVRLGSAAPNPSATAATIEYEITVPGRVRLALIDQLGREVRVLVEGERPAGVHRVALDAQYLVPGMYFVRLEAGGTAHVDRFTVAR